MIGSSISHYKVLEKLGQGGMGEVFLAEDTTLDRQVALKFLPAALWHEAEARERLIREAKAASKLDHPNVVTIYGIEETDGRPFIAMARVKGTALDEYCRSQSPSLEQKLNLAIQMADGIVHAHAAGVVHRDLKPSNILVDESGRARILDFGVASVRGASRLTKTGTTVGTLLYAPPEVVRGEQAGPASDIYSLGVVLYEMLSGHLPHEADHEAAILYAILHATPRPPSSHGASVPSALEAVIMKALDKQPGQRFRDAAELLAELERCAAATPRPTDDKPTLAVLPFANMSTDAENEYFADGLTEELLNVLAKNPGLMITGRTSSFAFKGKNVDIREIGQQLGVSTVLEGSVRRSGDRVRITAQLVTTSDGFHMWSETYDRVIDDIFAVQDEIAGAVAQELHVALLGGTGTAAAQGDGETFELMLQAHREMGKASEESLLNARKLIDAVLTKSPNNAKAWAGLARIYVGQAGTGVIGLSQGYRDAREAVERAIGLDPSLPEALETLGWLASMFDYQYQEGLEYMQRAVSAAPSNGLLHASLATHEALLGRFDEARSSMESSLQLDPLNAQVHHFAGRIAWVMEDYEAALRYFQRSLELSPDLTTGHANSGMLMAILGRPDEGLAEARREASGGYRYYALGCIYALRGDHEACLEAMEALQAEGDEWAVQLAAVQALHGDIDDAFKTLNTAFFLRDSGIPVIKVSPLYRNLRDDPRWPALLRRAGFPD